ncbi:T9SS type A sorting domain-containing protein [Bacteroidota bacterium]
MFDYDVGDEFHYLEDASDYTPGGFYLKVDRITILEKYYSNNSDTIFYKRGIEGYTKNLVPTSPASPYPWEYKYYFHSSTDEVFYTNLDSSIFHYLAEEHFKYLTDFPRNDPEFEISDSLVYKSEDFCNRTVNGYRFSNFYINDQFELGEGLGITYLSTEHEECHCHVKLLRLLYYKKGTDSCGTPDNRTQVDYLSILDKQKIWYNYIYEYFSWNVNTEVLGLGNDTILADTNYFQVLRATGGIEIPFLKYGFIRTDNEKVYYRTTSQKPERLIYDFSIAEGDTVIVYGLMNWSNDNFIECQYICDSIRPKDFYSIQRAVYFLSTTMCPECNYESWIEGIGSYSGLLHNYDGRTGSDAFYLSCVKTNDDYLFKKSESEPCIKITVGIDAATPFLPMIHPNPVKVDQELHIRYTSTSSIFELYNAVGKLVFKENLVSPEISLIIDVTPGLYFYRLASDKKNQFITGKIIFH